MKIELLYFDGCPSWQDGLKNLQTALRAEGMEDSVKLVKVQDDADAARQMFLGSPSFRINDVELWPEERESYSLSCRLYATQQGMRGSPSVEMLREKLCQVV
jgi:hypothetical protein